MAVAGVGAAGIGIEALNAMNQTVCQQKIERPVDRGGRAVKTLGPQLFQNSVGSLGLMAAPHQFQYPLALRRQTPPALSTDASRLGQRGANAAAMVVRLERLIILSVLACHLPAPCSLFYGLIRYNIT